MQNMRPGIFSDYVIEPLFSKTRGKSIAIAAKSNTIQNTVHKVTTLAQAKSLFGDEYPANNLVRIIKTIFENSSAAVYAVSVAGNTIADYNSAIDKLLQIDDAYIICPDISSDEIIQNLTTKLNTLADSGKEKLAIFGAKTKSLASQFAKNANSKRICITYPQIFAANSTVNLAPAALASIIAKSSDFSSNLNSQSISGSLKVDIAESEDNINSLISDGVCVFEQAGNSPQLIRGVTSSAFKTDGSSRSNYFNICVILTADFVIPELRSCLKSRLDSSRNTPASLDSILSIITCKLQDLLEAGFLSGYEMPSVYLNPDDNSTCIVDTKFTILQGINQIFLSAKISI